MEKIIKPNNIKLPVLQRKAIPVRRENHKLVVRLMGLKRQSPEFHFSPVILKGFPSCETDAKSSDCNQRA